ncbi:23S rRNA pseudouridine(2604) synthase RluF [Pedobacter riviphilus]|uniref:Pseudouridine synthase n=1 Tax=Pedobacter riviphilus TaxID=2766984 RepID=A0ABX6TL16_9SPHI|nr:MULTISPECIES: 23S rRNA pseudouridine(2604) synthase RluF [Pedobacter]NII86025.1 23S rRNA pseudouridine2604 synthase [Pedobacter sp. SG908]NMN39063.1 23S rRNA pseudouridine2604 synthase [Pedobacter sp. SG918]QNR83895.1 23S rRNA pseudouridine(2604) synthase RluF [Pedobacter riviphilus]
MNNNSATRLNKFISESGLCSRREADRYIEKGTVFINGKRAKVGDQVFAGDKVMVNGHNIEPKEESNFILLAFNKPVGITSTTEGSVRDNIVDYVNHSERIFPIGRLDKDSSGLIFLTNNGDIVNKILRAGNKHEKEYVVTVNKPITEDFIFEMSNGVPILGVNTRKCKVRQISTFVFNIILIQGLNRQIRRMCEHFGYEVTKLERTRIMNINLKGIPTGEFRELTEDEMKSITKSVENSSSEAKSKPKSTTKKKANAWEEIPELREEQPKKSFKAKSSGQKSSGKKQVGHAGSKPTGKSNTGNRNSRPAKGKAISKSNSRGRGR